MPAVSGKQLRKAYAEKAKGKSWGRKMVEDTPAATQRKLMSEDPAQDDPETKQQTAHRLKVGMHKDLKRGKGK